jgi:putative ABC transport system permease protein
VYPNLTPTLVVLLLIALAFTVVVAVRGPFLRRLAFRQVVRRRREATLVVLGSMLGTAIIVGSLVVGDTLNFSVKQIAYDGLGPVDETVISPALPQGSQVAARLALLANDPEVDGVLSAHGDVAAASDGSGGSRLAEPRVGVWDMDFSAATSFGGGRSGLYGQAPVAGQVVVNDELASSLGLHLGDTVTFYAYGGLLRAKVVSVLPSWGIAGMRLDGVQPNAFFPPNTLVDAAAASAAENGPVPRSFTFVSNAGGVEDGNALTSAVDAKIRSELGPLTTTGSAILLSKHDLLATAEKTGASMGALFLMIGSFAIFAGVLLLVNIFVMLAEARKPELGMLRAIGMRRSQLVRAFFLEGSVYAVMASVLGVIVGIGVGAGVSAIAAKVFGSQPGSTALHVVFDFTWVSLVNGFAMGLLIALVTVALTSLRISRINIIAAIRDLAPASPKRTKLRWVILGVISTFLFAILAMASISKSEPVGTYLFPALVIVCMLPLTLRFVQKRWAYTGAALLVLVWTLIANSLRPRLLDDSGSASFVIIGILLTLSAVVLASQNQEVITAPLRPLKDRASSGGLSTRLALAYPLGKRFRTGAILVMYGLVMFTLVFMTVLSALVQATVGRSVASASGGFQVRADFNPATPISDPQSAFASGHLAGKVSTVAALYTARAKVRDLAPVSREVDAVAVGVNPTVLSSGTFKLIERMRGFSSDRAAWQAMLSNPSYVIADNMLGQLGEGGPPKTLLHPGMTLTIADPSTGRSDRKTIVGLLDSAWAFYGMGGEVLSPVIMTQGAAVSQFNDLRPTSALVRVASGSSTQQVASGLQSDFMAQGLVATDIRQAVEDSYSTTLGFFQLMEGFIALGLLVGIAGLGVVMIRAVRERRRSIGALRALGFQSRTVQTAFLTESLFVTLEGVVIGAGLAVITAYMLFKNSAMFATTGGFSIPWMSITLLALATTFASVLATAIPARQAARIQPAVALRVLE